MERQHAHSLSFKSIAGAALAGLGILVLLRNLDWPVAQVGNFLCGRAVDALGLLPCIVLSAWQTLQAYAFDHQGLFAWPLQMLVLFWPLLHVLARAT
jgi:hypothetical protein